MSPSVFVVVVPRHAVTRSRHVAGLPNLMAVEADTAEVGADPDAPPPSRHCRLLAEVTDVLASDRWVTLDRGSEHVWLLTRQFYDAGALPRCCWLLYELEIEVASRVGCTPLITIRG